MSSPSIRTDLLLLLASSFETVLFPTPAGPVIIYKVGVNISELTDRDFKIEEFTCP